MTTSEPRSAGATEALPVIPVKRYFTIGEVSELCQVKPHVLRYWEQEFAQLRPVKRRGNRRYYQHHEVLLIRKIRSLLYDEGFTISGARSRLTGLRGRAVPDASPDIEVDAPPLPAAPRKAKVSPAAPAAAASEPVAMSAAVRTELEGILALLRSAPKKRKSAA